MRITKYEHACLVIEDGGKKLVIDPGDFSTLLPIESYDTLIVCDVHFDHLGEKNIKKLVAKNPSIPVYAVDQAAEKLNGIGIKAKTVTAGQKVLIAGFDLEFFGGQHAPIHPDWPKFPNVGVLVNDKLYYPGDSFDGPNRSVEVLALPDSGPWYKLEHAIDLLLSVKPKICFQTHDHLVSEAGKNVNTHFLTQACEKSGTQLKQLKAGQSLEV